MRVLGLLLSCLLLSSGLTWAASPPKMNVVIFLIDDMGWTDVGCFGSTFYETPHIDKLAADGMKFTQAYSACTVCSPSRAALLTGKYPGRLHITDWIPGLPPGNPKLTVPDFTRFLPHGETSLAEVFHDAGYATAAIGKWHLGGEEYYPNTHGFDMFLAGTHAPSPKTYFAPYGIPTLPEGPKGEYLTDRLGEEAARFIKQQGDQPFFLYLSHFAVHLPVQGKSDLIDKYKARLKPGQAQKHPVYAAMVESVDDTVGLVRKTLEQQKIADRTLIVFTSDNGGRVPTTSNLPLRVGKGSCYEGGTRVPMIIYWPGVTEPGSVCDVPVIGTDIFRTTLHVVGIPDPATAVDGEDLVPLLKQTGTLKRDALFWHYPHYQHYQLGGTTPYGAIRMGDYKLIEFFDDKPAELYNLGEDIGEEHNLAESMPHKLEELRERLHAWQKEADVQMPSPNPNYDPTRPEHTPKK